MSISNDALGLHELDIRVFLEEKLPLYPVSLGLHALHVLGAKLAVIKPVLKIGHISNWPLKLSSLVSKAIKEGVSHLGKKVRDLPSLHHGTKLNVPHGLFFGVKTNPKSQCLPVAILHCLKGVEFETFLQYPPSGGCRGKTSIGGRNDFRLRPIKKIDGDQT